MTPLNGESEPNQGNRPATAVFPSDSESGSSEIADLGDLLCDMHRLDTNALLSGISYPARVPGEITAAWRHGSVEVILSDFTKP